MNRESHDKKHVRRGSYIRFTVVGWVQIGQRVTNTFICGYRLKKYVCLRLLTKNIFRHTAVMAAVQRLRLTQFTVSHRKTNSDMFFVFASYERPCVTKKKLAFMGYSQVNCTNPKTGMKLE